MNNNPQNQQTGKKRLKNVSKDALILVSRDEIIQIRREVKRLTLKLEQILQPNKGSQTD